MNQKQGRVFIQHIAEVQMKTLQSKIAAARFFSIMSDDSTDTAVMKQEMPYVCLCNQGKVEVHFVGIQDVENISQPINYMMRVVCGEEEWQAKLVACATDGASVMTGAC